MGLVGTGQFLTDSVLVGEIDLPLLLTIIPKNTFFGTRHTSWALISGSSIENDQRLPVDC